MSDSMTPIQQMKGRDSVLKKKLAWLSKSSSYFSIMLPFANYIPRMPSRCVVKITVSAVRVFFHFQLNVQMSCISFF